MRSLVLGVDRVQFTDSETGDVISGCQVHHAPMDEAPRRNGRGYQVVTEWAPVSVWESLVELPGVYELDYSMRREAVNGKVKTVAKLRGLAYVGPFVGAGV